MELDLETFLITLYITTDEWYQKVILPQLPACGAAACPGRPNVALCAMP